MIAVWILLGLLTLIILVCLLRVGVRTDYGEGQFTLDFLFFAFRVRVVPAKPKKETAKKAKEKAEKKPKDDAAKEKPSFRDILDLFKTLLPPLGRALNKTRRGVRIDPMDVSLILAGLDEPADAAQLYGELTGLTWAFMPLLEKYLVLPRPHIHLGVDYTAQETKLSLRLALTSRIGTLLHIAFTLAIPALRWYLAYRNKTKVRKEETDGKGYEEPAA